MALVTIGPVPFRSIIAKAGGYLGEDWQRWMKDWLAAFNAGVTTVVPTFSAANFTANGAMTWTVGEGDVVSYQWVQRGPMVDLLVSVNSTTVGGVANTELRVALPPGLTVGATGNFTYLYSDAGGALTVGLGAFVAGDAFVRFLTATGANWTLTGGPGFETAISASVSIPVA